MKRRQLLAGLTGLGLAAGAAGQAAKAPLKIIVGFPPGGSADVIARLVADRLREGPDPIQAIVENKPGAGGRVAIDLLKAAPADGQTVLVMPSGPVVLFPHVFKKLNYDPQKDLAPISQLAGFQFALSSGPKTAAKTLPELIAKAKADAGSATYGSPGNGTVPHFLGLMIGDAAGVPLQHVPFQGGAPAMTALLGGHVGAVIDVVSEALEQHRAGKIRIVAVTGAHRSPQVPEVPTLREQGLALDASAWFAMYAPAGVPAATRLRLSDAVAAAVKDPGVSKRLGEMGFEAIGSTPEQLAAVQRADSAKWEKPVKASGFQAD